MRRKQYEESSIEGRNSVRYLRVQRERKQHLRLHLGEVRGRDIVEFQQSIQTSLLVGRSGKLDHLHSLHEVGECLVYLSQHIQVGAKQLDDFFVREGALRVVPDLNLILRCVCRVPWFVQLTHAMNE